MATHKEKHYYQPDSVSPPGETLKELLDERGMSQTEFALRVGKPEKTISAIVNGNSSITPETALKFEKVLGTPAKFWLSRDANYQEYKARLQEEEELEDMIAWVKEFPLAAMRKYGWIEKVMDKKQEVKLLLTYFGLASRDEFDVMYLSQSQTLSYRLSLTHTQEPKALAAWLRQGDLQARDIPVAEFRPASFKSILKEIKVLAYESPTNFKQQLQELCASVGVRVVYTPCIPKAPVSGATRWKGNNPIIQLTDRGKRHDKFWFTFFHEAGHVLLHGKKASFIEGASGIEVDEEKEKEADNFATQTLIHRSKFDEFLDNFHYEVEEVLEFADEVQVHPGIIIGRLHHHELLSYTQGQHLFLRLDLFDNN